MAEAVLQMRGVTRVLGAGPGAVTALQDIDFEVLRGEMVALTGRSGSGKSTLLNLAGGLDDPTEGSVAVEGRFLAGLTPRARAAERRRHIGIVFQSLNLMPALTAVENVALPLEFDGVKHRKATSEAAEALRRVGLDANESRYPDELSGGEQQRVAIARGIVGSRRLVLADEPTGALDELSGEAVMSLLRTLADEGLAVVVATHDSALAGWADRVIRLRDGRIDMVTTRSTTPPTPADLHT